MKYPVEQFYKLTEALPIVLNFFNITPAQVEPTNVGLLNTLHYKVYQQKNYTDDNANIKYVDGKRLLPIDESFKLYPDGCNDDHIETAMKNAIKSLISAPQSI